MSDRDSVRTCPACGAVVVDAAEGRCGLCGAAVAIGDTVATGDRRREDAMDTEPGLFALPQMRYPNAYVWLVLAASLDIILTMLVLYLWNGFEVNPISAAVIAEFGFLGAIIFKFATIVFAIIICEFVGRRDDRSGRTLAVGAVILTAIPVAYTFALLFRAGPAV